MQQAYKQYERRQLWYKDVPELDDPLAPVHRRLFPHVQAVEEDQQDIHLQNVLNCQLYTNRQPMAFNWNEPLTAYFKPLNANLENGIQSVVDTLNSKITQQRPKATIIPRGAEFGTYLKARRLDKFLWGEFRRFNIWALVSKVFVDACVYGTGFLKICDDYGEAIVERINPDEVIVDQRECISDSMPTQMFHRTLRSRMWLLETYGDDEEMRQAIYEAQRHDFSYTSYRNPVEDQIVVVEAWKRETRPGAGDGRHAICIENCTLLDEAWNKQEFPIIWLKYAEPQDGFYGRSLAGDLIGYQIRLNDLNELILEGQDIACIPRLLRERGSAVVGQMVDTKIGREIEWAGSKPEFWTGQAFSAEIYQERDRVRASMFEFAGLSQVSAQAKLPSQARMDSAPAFREYSAIEDDRFNAQTQAVEDFYKCIAGRLLKVYAKLYKDKKVDTKTVYYARNLAEQIDWSQVDMDEDLYVLEIGASSVINMTNAAREDRLNEWLMKGLITPEYYMAHSGMPDLEQLKEKVSAHYEYAQWTVDQLMDVKAEAPSPDPKSNLMLQSECVGAAWARLRTMKKVPHKVFQRIDTWQQLAEGTINPEPTEAEQMAAAQGAMPLDPAVAGMPPEMAGVPPDAMGGAMPPELLPDQMPAGPLVG